MGLGRVLVIDEETDVQQSVRLIVTKAGYDVVEAKNGEKTIEAIRSGDHPLMVDAVVCDLHMPNVNGTEAIGFCRVQVSSVPIWVMTGDANLDRVMRLFKKGIADYL